MKILYVIPVVIFLIFFAGCASVDTSSDYVNGVNFASFKTYDWVAGPQPLAGDARIDNTLTDSRIRKAVDSALASKGFVKTASGNPDFLVAYQAAIQGKLDVTTVDIPYSTPSGADIMRGNYHGSTLAYGGTETFVNQYEEGTLLIDMINPQTKELMWRGTGKATVLEKAKPEKREARIKEGVEKILSQFPPV